MVILIGNKVDKPDKVISNEMGAELARNKGWGFMEVSAKEDINIKSAFQTLVTNIFQVKVQGSQVNTSSLPIGDTRAPSISLHNKENSGSGRKGSSGKKKNKDGGCCK